MEHPVKEIAGVITSLTGGSPEVQENTIKTYFLSDASFTHPFCRVPSFGKGTIPLLPNVDSQYLLLGIYRWYRTLSPKIDLTVDSAVFDQRTGLLYCSIRQTFAVWFIPFYKAPVKLVTVLHLKQRTSWDASETVGHHSLTEAGVDGTNGQGHAKYYIASQDDMYQTNDCIQFLMPGLGPLLWFAWQLFSTGMCVIGSILLLPMFLLLNKDTGKKTA